MYSEIKCEDECEESKDFKVPRFESPLPAASLVSSPSKKDENERNETVVKVSQEDVHGVLPEAWFVLTELRDENRDSHEVVDEVCYGMITDIPFLVFRELLGAQRPANRIVKLSQDNKLFQLVGDQQQELGEFQPRMAEILRTLAAQEPLKLQGFSRLNHGDIKWTVKESKRKKRSTVVISIYVIIYGPDHHAPMVGDFIAKCGISLQDPIHPVRDTIYRNPHLLIMPGEGIVSTLAIAPPARISSRVESLTTKEWDSIMDLEVFAPRDQTLPETEAHSQIRTRLLSHQKEGLSFLLRREQLTGPEKDTWLRTIKTDSGMAFVDSITGVVHPTPPPTCDGGLLADHMGLGKTLQILALIASNPAKLNQTTSVERELSAEPQMQRAPATLIIVPASLISSWVSEIERHFWPGGLSFYVFHRKRSAISEILDRDIIITTSSIILSEFKRSTSSQASSSLYSVRWHRLVFDEAHEIRNAKTATARAACALSADHRWAVTSRPSQNRLTDIGSLLTFLRVYPFSNPRVFQSEIVLPIVTRKDEIRRLQVLMGAVSLCRTKELLSLPDQLQETHRLVFSPAEQELYDSAKTGLHNLISSKVAKTPSASGNALLSLNKLRLICNHGLLESTLKIPNPASTEVDMESTWDSGTAQKSFDNLLSLGVVKCASCGEEIGNVTQEDEQTSRCRLFKCLRIICNSCFSKPLGASENILCAHKPLCPSQEVSVGIAPAVDVLSAQLESGEIPTKIKALLQSIQSLSKTEKCVVYSCWSRTLAIIELALRKELISCHRIDGTVPSTLRAQYLQNFQTSDVQVMLISSAFSPGTDLTAASRLYIMEPQWNVAVEEQIISRVHRIGQKKKVTIIRYIIQNSFEEDVVDAQTTKKSLASIAFSGSESSGEDESLAMLQVGSLL